MRMAGRMVIAASLAAALAVGTGVTAQAGHDAGAAGGGKGKGREVAKRAFVVGDSLAVGTKPYLVRALRGWRVGHSVSISKHAPEGASELGRRGARALPPVVVASLGTNDDPGAVSSFDHSVRVALRAVGKRGCVVWPSIVRPPVGGRTYARYNSVLRRLAGKRRNLVVFNWTRMAGRNRQWFGDDGVHPTGVGYSARARGIANGVRECRRRLVNAESEGGKRK